MTDPAPQDANTLIQIINAAESQLVQAGVSFGHGTTNARDEAIWLILWSLGLPLDTPLDSTDKNPESKANMPLAAVDIGRIAMILGARIQTRKPAAYLTQEAWLQGEPFYVDERVIIPRSLIAELLVQGGFDSWLSPTSQKVLDLCTGNGSLAVIAAKVFPEVSVIATDISSDALDVARINVDKHGLGARIALVQSDGLGAPAIQASGPFDLIVCNPPYVNADSMAQLPAEYLAEPSIALDGNCAGGRDGMDFIRKLIAQVKNFLTPDGILVLEIGNERMHFEAAYPSLEVVWLETSAGEDQVLLISRDILKQ
jgi:ribosomal protein L3 glutamine methyltransferase